MILSAELKTTPPMFSQAPTRCAWRQSCHLPALSRRHLRTLLWKTPHSQGMTRPWLRNIQSRPRPRVANQQMKRGKSRTSLPRSQRQSWHLPTGLLKKRFILMMRIVPVLSAVARWRQATLQRSKQRCWCSWADSTPDTQPATSSPTLAKTRYRAAGAN